MRTTKAALLTGERPYDDKILRIYLTVTVPWLRIETFAYHLRLKPDNIRPHLERLEADGVLVSRARSVDGKSGPHEWSVVPTTAE